MQARPAPRSRNMSSAWNGSPASARRRTPKGLLNLPAMNCRFAPASRSATRRRRGLIACGNSRAPTLPGRRATGKTRPRVAAAPGADSRDRPIASLGVRLGGTARLPATYCATGFNLGGVCGLRAAGPLALPASDRRTLFSRAGTSAPDCPRRDVRSPAHRPRRRCHPKDHLGSVFCAVGTNLEQPVAQMASDLAPARNLEHKRIVKLTVVLTMCSHRSRQRFCTTTQ